MTTERRYWTERETMTPGDLRADQLARLKPLLEWAFERSPYYRCSFTNAGIRPVEIHSLDTFVERVPFVSKEAIIEAERAKPPFGDFLAVHPTELARIGVGPGPLYMPFTAEDIDGKCEASVIAMWCAGVRPFDVADVTLNYHWVTGGIDMDAAYRKIGCAVIPGGVGNTKMHLEVMHHLGVTTTFGFPTYFLHLAETAREMGIDIRKDLSLRVAMIGGELKPKAALAELEEQYGMNVREVYGTADCGQIGFECDERAGMHLGPHQIVEILDPETHRPVADGSGGEIAATPLWRKGMPIIRYLTGDIVAYVSHEPCSCGRYTPRLGPIVGRVSDIPKVKGMFVVPKQVENALYSFNGLGRFQMIIDRPQLGDTLTVCIEAASGVDRAGAKAAVASALRDAIRIGAEVEFVDTLPEGAPLVVDRRKTEVN